MISPRLSSSPRWTVRLNVLPRCLTHYSRSKGFPALDQFGLQPHRKQQRVTAPEASAAFVANMEGVLEACHRPHDPKRSLTPR